MRDWLISRECRKSLCMEKPLLLDQDRVFKEDCRPYPQLTFRLCWKAHGHDLLNSKETAWMLLVELAGNLPHQGKLYKEKSLTKGTPLLNYLWENAGGKCCFLGTPGHHVVQEQDTGEAACPAGTRYWRNHALCRSLLSKHTGIQKQTFFLL